MGSLISLGKYGTFQANHLLGRPYHLTFEILDKPKANEASKSGLRIVAAAELYADIIDEESGVPSEDGTGGNGIANGGVEYDIVGEDGEAVMRTNRNIIDDATSQGLTMDQIEAMKADSSGSGKELVAKILESHSALDEKTAFALAKYTLRKTKKYLKRFTVLPLDVSNLAKWVMTEKEPLKIMEMREEILALIGSWSNVHFTPSDPTPVPDEQALASRSGRWLVMDETAGLLVAYMAEKMGILHAPYQDEEVVDSRASSKLQSGTIDEAIDQTDIKTEDPSQTTQQHQPRPHKTHLPATTNTITLLHANAQPNLSLLKYFHFDAFNNPSPTHPLTDHLKTLSWLQLLDPENDAGYTEPPTPSPEEFQTWKSGKRSNYYRKRRRWTRIKYIVDETRAGGFDGLIVASVMNPIGILRHCVPLLRGAAQIVVYSPTIERLVELADVYSSARRTAFVTNPPDPATMPNEDFPVDPTLLLAPAIQTARCRSWQVLPGRTHPLMTGRGGAEGYIFTATRVLPAEGRVEARGIFKRRRVDAGAIGISMQQVGTPQAMTTGAEGQEVDVIV